jgi:uncharacterized protein
MSEAIQSKERLLALIKDNRPKLQALGVKRLGLFGSFVRGEQRAESDVDMLVEFQPGQKTFDNFMRLGFMLEELFGRRVELITPESLSPYIRPHVMQEVQDALVLR